MITVIGASGRTGRAVVETLQSSGMPVRRVTRAGDGARSSVSVATLTDEEALVRAFDGAEAAYVVLPDDLRAHAFHAERRRTALAIARAVRRTNLPRVVFVSSSVAALGDDTRCFGADLAHLEGLLFDTQAAVTVLRAAYFQDNVVAALPIARRDGIYPSLFRSAKAAIAMVAAADVGAIAARTLLASPKAPCEIVDVIGPAYSAGDIATILGRRLGRTIMVPPLPPEARAPMLGAWMSKEAASAMVATMDALVVGRDLLRGDRIEVGTTELDHVVAAALRDAPSEAAQ